MYPKPTNQAKESSAPACHGLEHEKQITRPPNTHAQSTNTNNITTTNTSIASPLPKPI
jgi:hypothetical protein